MCNREVLSDILLFHLENESGGGINDYYSFSSRYFILLKFIFHEGKGNCSPYSFVSCIKNEWKGG